MANVLVDHSQLQLSDYLAELKDAVDQFPADEQGNIDECRTPLNGCSTEYAHCSHDDEYEIQVMDIEIDEDGRIQETGSRIVFSSALEIAAANVFIQGDHRRTFRRDVRGKALTGFVKHVAESIVK